MKSSFANHGLRVRQTSLKHKVFPELNILISSAVITALTVQTTDLLPACEIMRSATGPLARESSSCERLHLPAPPLQA